MLTSGQAPSDIYTKTPWLRDLLLSSPLIPSALPAERKRLCADSYLRPQSEWTTPLKDQQPLDVKIFIGVFVSQEEATSLFAPPTLSSAR
jgi:hypothetical protein